MYHCAAAALRKAWGNRGGTVAVSKGNEAGPVVVAPRRSREALAVSRRVPSDQTYSPWGMLAAIDLHGCERSRLEDPGTLRRFVPSLVPISTARR